MFSSLGKEKAKKAADALKKGFELRQKKEAENAAQLEKLAQELFEAGHSMMEADLSDFARKELARVREFGWGVCSRCRWQSGCLSCEPGHCLRYWMKKEKPAWLQKRLELKAKKEAIIAPP